MAELDFFTSYNLNYRDLIINDDPYFGVTVNSSYHDVNSLSALCTRYKSPIYLSINIQSLMSKHENLTIELAELEKNNVCVDAIAIQETWDIKYSDLVSINGFCPVIFKRRRGMRGGGVGFYVRNGIQAEIIEGLSPFENKIIESLTVQLTYPDHKTVMLTSIYRSNGPLPNVTASQQLDRFMIQFSQLLSDINDTKKRSYVFLDANINILQLHSLESANYLNCILSKGYLQIITKASRIHNDSKTLIDHVLSNSGGTEICSGTLISDISDHFFTFVAPCVSSAPKQQHRTVSKRIFSQHNLNEFKRDMSQVDWNPVIQKSNINEAYDVFWNNYNTIFERSFPLRRVRFNKNIHKLQNFMTNGLLVSRNTKNVLHKTSIADPTDANIRKYKAFKTIYQRVSRAAKKLYFTSKLEANANNPKKTWETLNEILGKNKKSETVEKICKNGVNVTDPVEIANCFNSFFTAVGQQISDSVPPVLKNPEEYINYGRAVPDLLLQNTTPEHIQKVIKKLQPKMSYDANGVSSKMIKFIGEEISIPLAHIFNISLREGVFPEKLKLCRVIPIFKSGNPLECDNFRPISLLSSISKVLEKIVAEKLIAHLLDNDLIYVHQYGFLPNRSTEHNLLQIINYISNALNEGDFCIGVFLDLKKAFDVCSHEILLKKLLKMGIRGNAYKWFENYLSGRTQFVDINGSKSDPLEINISVIQGSILGPILFLCYINDFYAATTLFSVLFADDTTGLGKGKNLRDLTTYVNGELQNISNWFRANKMAINTSKTKFIVFRTRGKRIDPADCQLVFNNNEIGQIQHPDLIFPITRIHGEGEEKSFKLLGVLFDEYLSFDAHITSLCNKISKSLFCLNRIKNFVTPPAMKMLYFAMVHSHIVYCINVFSCANITTLSPLKIKQKEAIRIVCNAGYRDHTGPLFKRLGILPLDDLIKYSQLKFMHDYFHRKLPLSFNETWIQNRNRNPELALRNANNLYVPAHHLATTKRFPLFTFPKTWNDASDSKYNPSRHVFLKSVKTAMLNEINA